MLKNNRNVKTIIKNKKTIRDNRTKIEKVANRLYSSLIDRKVEEIEEVGRLVLLKEDEKYFIEVGLGMNRVDKPRVPSIADYKDGNEQQKLKSGFSDAFSNVTWSHLKYKTQLRKGNDKKWYSHLHKDEGEVSLMDFLIKQARVSTYFGSENVSTSKGRVKKDGKLKKVVYFNSALRNPRKKFTVDDQSGRGIQQETKVSVRNSKTGSSNEEMRPLFEPIRMYFIKHRIPTKIISELKRKGFKNARFR